MWDGTFVHVTIASLVQHAVHLNFRLMLALTLSAPTSFLHITAPSAQEASFPTMSARAHASELHCCTTSTGDGHALGARLLLEQA